MCKSLNVAVNKCINWCFVHLSCIRWIAFGNREIIIFLVPIRRSFRERFLLLQFVNLKRILAGKSRPIFRMYALDTAVGKRVRSRSLYHSRQCGIVLKPRSDRIEYTVICFMMHDCSRKLRKQHHCERAERGLIQTRAFGEVAQHFSCTKGT